MSYHTIHCELNGSLVRAEYEFIGNPKHGDFDLNIEAVYENGYLITDQLCDEDFDAIKETICADVDLSAIATEEMLDRADWLRDQAKDRQ